MGVPSNVKELARKTTLGVVVSQAEGCLEWWRLTTELQQLWEHHFRERPQAREEQGSLAGTERESLSYKGSKDFFTSQCTINHLDVA